MYIFFESGGLTIKLGSSQNTIAAGILHCRLSQITFHARDISTSVNICTWTMKPRASARSDETTAGAAILSDGTYQRTARQRRSWLLSAVVAVLSFLGLFRSMFELGPSRLAGVGLAVTEKRHHTDTASADGVNSTSTTAARHIIDSNITAVAAANTAAESFSDTDSSTHNTGIINPNTKRHDPDLTSTSTRTSTGDLDALAVDYASQNLTSDNPTNATSNSTTPVSSPSSPPWAALCAVMRDEDRYIDEWADYHLALGFEQLHIYDSHPNFTLARWYEWRNMTDPT
jgi:hypothetical protein